MVLDGTMEFKCIGNLNSRMQGSDTSMTPLFSGTGFTPYTDVFVSFLGQEAYYGTNSQPAQRTDYVYRKGAVVGWGQSYSAQPVPCIAIDWDYGTRSLENLTETNCLAQAASVYVKNDLLSNNPRFYVSRAAGGVTTATATVSSNTVTLKENGATVATINITPGSMRSIVAAIRAALPSGSWYLAVQEGGAESRCMSSIKAGACIAIGSIVEPTTAGGFKSSHLISGLWRGDAMGEIAFRLQMPVHPGSANSAKGMTIYGDPLYRPFSHRL
jgi:hypothetical protein